MPQLIKKIYGAGTTWFYRFACAIVTKAQSSLMTRLFHIVLQVLKVCLIKIFKIKPPDLLFPVAFISFYIIRYHFSQIFRTSFKRFSSQISFLTDSLKRAWMLKICDLLQGKWPYNFVFSTVFRRSQLGLTTFHTFWYKNILLKLR